MAGMLFALFVIVDANEEDFSGIFTYFGWILLAVNLDDG